MKFQENMHYSTVFKCIAASVCGACLGLLAVGSTFRRQDTSETDVTNLLGGTASLSTIARLSSTLPGASPWKELALAAIQTSNGCGRDVSVRASPLVKSVFSSLDSEKKAEVQRLAVAVHAKTKAKAKGPSGLVAELPGILPPLNFFDPVGFSTDVPDGRLLFMREAEVKHGRVCMQATLGFFVAERFHPFFGGENDAPSLFAANDASLGAFWPAIFIVIGGIETFSFGRDAGGLELAPGLAPGDIGWDPLGLAPADAEAFETIQNKEILNGRLAMISLLGQVAEEYVTGEKLHGAPF